MATRQLLLLSGDVETNPGWQGVIDRDGDYLQDFARTSNHRSNLSFAHINIRSLRNKVDEVKVLLHVCRFDILAITETHLDRKISNSHLEIDNYKIIRRDRDANTMGGGCLLYIASHICSTRPSSQESSDIEAIWLKIMVNSSAFIIGTVYRPPSSDSLFFERFQDLLEKLWIKRRNVVIVGDFNCDSARSTDRSITSISGQKLQNLLLQFDYMVINDKPTRVTKDTSTLIDLVISSNRNLIKNTRIVELGISDHMLVHASVQTKIKRPPPKIIKARSYKKIDQAKFSKDIAEAPWSVCDVFDDLDDCYWAWKHIFGEICNKHARFRAIKARRQSLPWISPKIRHLMNLRYKTLLRAKMSNNQELWTEYRSLRNRVTHEVRVAKSRFYVDLFDEVKDCKSYWNLVKKAAYRSASQPILGLKTSDGSMETSDYKKAQILNAYFSTVGEKLASDLPVCRQVNNNSYINRVTPCIMNISISHASVAESIDKMKTNKACGPDNVSPKLLKYAGKDLIPSSVFSVFHECRT